MNSNELDLRNEYFYEIFGKMRKSDTFVPTQPYSLKAQPVVDDVSIEDDEGEDEDEDEDTFNDILLTHDTSAQYKTCLLYTSRCV